MSIQLAFVGVTNSGKTSLIRTILRRPVGDVADRADVTIHSEVVPPTDEGHEGFFATLVDTPGLKEAELYLSYLRAVGEVGEESASKIFQADLTLERRVHETIRSCDVVIYVVAVDEDVPSQSFFSQMEMCRRFGHDFIVVLNKLRRLSDASNAKKLQRRVEAWTKASLDHGAKAVVPYDAHWSTSLEQNRFFEAVQISLPGFKMAEFAEGVEQFRQRQAQLRTKSIELAVDCIVRCRSNDIADMISETKEGGTDREYLARLADSINESSNEALQQFTDDVTRLYRLASEMPLGAIEDLDIDVPVSRQAISFTAVLATLGLAVFSGVGAIVGLATALGVATTAGAIGGSLGTIVGFAGVKSEKDKLYAKQAGMVAVYCLDILWVLSCYGWAQGHTIPKELSDAVSEQSKYIAEGMDPMNWHTASVADMELWMQRFMQRIDDRDYLELG